MVAADLDKPALHSGHRCDRCASRAYVHVVIELSRLNESGYHDDGELFFCAHHAKAHLPTLKASGKIRHLIDETRLLSEHVKDDHWVEGEPARNPYKPK